MYEKTLKTALITILMILLLLPLAPSRTEAAVPAHSESFYVNDFAGVIDQKTENYMVNYGVKLHQQTGAQVVLVTVNTTNGTSMEEYATSLFNAWGVGSADKNNGVLLLLSTQDDDYWAVPGKGLEDTLNDKVLSRILSESLEPDFAAKNYSAGARKTYGSLIQELGGIYSETVGTKNYVSDNAGVFKQVTKDYLNQSSNRYAATTGSGIYVVTIKNSGDKSLQDYTYAKFAGVAAGPKDVMLVLDIGGDNYHVLQGKAIDGILTNERIGGILDTVLEPEFAAKDYAGGATGTANAFYSFFLARADASLEAAAAGSKSTAAAGTQSPVKSHINDKPKPVSASTGLKIMGVYLIIIAIFSLAASGRNRLIARFGSRLNPFNQQNINRLVTRFGSGSTMRQRRHRRHERHRNEALNHSSSQSSFWGSNEGGGGSSSGGGVGRHSSYQDENEGDGGSTNGGGAGRYSSYDDDDDNNAGGGGSASSGGGVGRHR
ncbi:TPM domain-containing protein [Paenibacillus sp. FSL R5-0912]|uniref:TPM domain-containing protein n=1 Tax=Paenibacillus sp. FSL R5-0912 TaxID=1536771 RepID=UPI0006934CA5|nr:TPM domain-containing protein [Paenibacillus sp. FSL R5-0912]